MNTFLRQRFPLTLVCLSACWLAGCDIPERPPIGPPPSVADSPPDSPLAEQEVLEPPSVPFSGRWEAWDAYFVRGRQVGFAHLVAEPVSESEDGDVRYQLESSFYVKQGESRLLQRLTETSTESNIGELLGFQSVLRVGPVQTEFQGTVEDDTLRIETIRGSSRTTDSIPWESTHRGLVALEQSLRQAPMTERGETRVLRILLPGKYQLATARIRCSGTASVPLIDGSVAELIEMNCEIQTGEDAAAYSTIWTSEDGSIVRTYSPALQFVAYRTDQDTATGFAGNDSIAASVAVDGKLKKPRRARRVAYRLLRSASAIAAGKQIDFQPQPGQFVRDMGDDGYQVLVSRRKENVAKGFVASDLLPVKEDSLPNYLIDSNALEVRELAQRSVASNMTPSEVAAALTKTVHQLVTDNREADGFTPASDTAEYLTGDDVDRAILLAALLQTRKIPARLVIGLRYQNGPAVSEDAQSESGSSAAPSANRMVYHAWTMAYLDDRWVQLDPSQGGMAGADRLIFVTTNLHGGNEYDVMNPLLDALPRVNIRIIGQN